MIEDAPIAHKPAKNTPAPRSENDSEAARKSSASDIRRGRPMQFTPQPAAQPGNKGAYERD